MYRFTAEGRRTAKTWCPVTGGKHVQDEALAQQDTFYCRRCGAIPKDSVHYDVKDPVMDDPSIVQVKKTVDCPGCNGTGYSSKTKKTCSVCSGTGKITADV